MYSGKKYVIPIFYMLIKFFEVIEHGYRLLSLKKKIAFQSSVSATIPRIGVIPVKEEGKSKIHLTDFLFTSQNLCVRSNFLHFRWELKFELEWSFL